MGLPACVCCARPLLLERGFVNGKPHRYVGALGPRSPLISLRMGFCVTTCSSHPTCQWKPYLMLQQWWSWWPKQPDKENPFFLQESKLPFLSTLCHQHVPWQWCQVGDSSLCLQSPPLVSSLGHPGCHCRSWLISHIPSALQERQPGQSWGQPSVVVAVLGSGWALSTPRKSWTAPQDVYSGLTDIPS